MQIGLSTDMPQIEPKIGKPITSGDLACHGAFQTCTTREIPVLVLGCREWSPGTGAVLRRLHFPFLYF